MRDFLFTLTLISAVAFLSFRVGYERAQTIYLEKIEEGERALSDALQRSAQTLSELSRTSAVDDDRDSALLQEITDAEISAGDECRVRIDILRRLDAITP